MNTGGEAPEALPSYRRGPNSNSDLQALSESFDQSTEHVPLVRRVGNPQNDVTIKGILKGGKSYNLHRDVRGGDDGSTHHHQNGKIRGSCDDPTAESKKKYLSAHDSYSVSSDRLTHPRHINNVIPSSTTSAIAPKDNNKSYNQSESGRGGSSSSSNNNSSGSNNQKRDIVIPAPSRKYTTTNPGTLSPIYHLIYDLTSPTSPSSIDTTTTPSSSLPSSSSTTTTNHHTAFTTDEITTSTTTTTNAYKYNKPTTTTTNSRNLHHHDHHHHHNQTNLATDVNHVNTDPKIPVGQFCSRDGLNITATGTTEYRNPPLPTGKQEHPLPPLPPRSSASSSVPSHFVDYNNTKSNQRNSNYLQGHGNRVRESDGERGEKRDAPNASDINTFAATTVGNVNGPHSSPFLSQPQPPPRFNYVGNNTNNDKNSITNINHQNHNIDTITNSSWRLDSSSFHSNVNPDTVDSRLLSRPERSHGDYRVNSNEDIKATGSGIGRLHGDAHSAINNRDAILNKSSSGVNEVSTVSRLVASNNVDSVLDRQKNIPRDAKANVSSSSHLTANNNHPLNDPSKSSIRFCSNSDQDNSKKFVLSDFQTRGNNSAAFVANGCGDIESDSTQNLGYQRVNNHAANSICDKDIALIRAIHSDSINASGFVDSDSGIACRGSSDICIAKSNGDFRGNGVKGLGIIKGSENKANGLVNFDKGRNENGKRPVAKSGNNEISGDPKRAVFKRDGDSVRLFLVQDLGDSHCKTSGVDEKNPPGNKSQTNVISCANISSSHVRNKENGVISNKFKNKLSVLSPSGVVSKLNQKSKDKKKSKKQQQRRDEKSSSGGLVNGVVSSGNLKRSPVNRWEQIHVRHTKHPVTSLSSDLENDKQIISSLSSSIESREQTHHVFSSPSAEFPSPSSIQQQHHPHNHHHNHHHHYQPQQQNVSLFTGPENVTCGPVSDFNNGIWTGEIPGSANTNASAFPPPASRPAIRGILVNKGNRSILRREEVVGGESGGGGQGKHKTRGAWPSVQKQNGVHFLDDTRIPSSPHISHSNVSIWQSGSSDSCNISSSSCSPNTQRREVIDRSKYIIKPNKSTSSFLSQSLDDALRASSNGPVTSLQGSSSNNTISNRGTTINKKGAQNTFSPLSPQGALTRAETRFITADRYTILSPSKSTPQHSLTSISTTPPTTTATTARLYLDQQESSVGNSNKINITSYTSLNTPCTDRGSQSRRFEDLTCTVTQGHADDNPLPFDPNHTQGGQLSNPSQVHQGLAIKRSGETLIQDYNRPDGISSTPGTFLDHCAFEGRERVSANAPAVVLVNDKGDNPTIDSQGRILKGGSYMHSAQTVNCDPAAFNFDAGRGSSGRYDREKGGEGVGIWEDSETSSYTAQLKEAGKKSSLRNLYGADYQLHSGATGECVGIDFGIGRRQERDNYPAIHPVTGGFGHSHNSQDGPDSGLHASVSTMTTAVTAVGKQLPPKITPRQKFEILHSRVSKKVATNLRHNNPNTAHEDDKQTEHYDDTTDTQTGTSQSLNDCVISKHDTLQHSVNSLCKDSPRARFERDRAARANAVTVTNTIPNTDNLFYHPSDTEDTSTKFNKSCDDLDTSTFGYLKPTHSRNHSSETGTIPYLDAQYSALPPLPTLPPRPAPRQSLLNKKQLENNGNRINQNNYTKLNVDVDIDYKQRHEINPNSLTNKIDDNFHSGNSNGFNGNYSSSPPKPLLPPRSSNKLDRSNVDNKDTINKDFTTKGTTFHTAGPLRVHYNTTRPSVLSPEQRGHNNLDPLGTALLRSPQSSEAAGLAPNVLVSKHKRLAEFETSLANANIYVHGDGKYLGVKNNSINSENKEADKREESRFLSTSYNHKANLPVSGVLSAITTTITTHSAYNNNIDISSGPASSGVTAVSRGVAIANRLALSSGEGSESWGTISSARSDGYTDGVGNDYNYYTKSHSTFVSSHQRVNEDLLQIQQQQQPDTGIILQPGSASITYSNNNTTSAVRVSCSNDLKSVTCASYDNGIRCSERVYSGNGHSLYSSSVNNSISDNVNKPGGPSDACGDFGVVCSVPIKDEVSCRKGLDGGINNTRTNSNSRLCACVTSGETCPVHQQKSCLEVPRPLKASATKKMSPDSVSSSGYESEHPVSGIRFLKEGQFETSIVNTDNNSNNNPRSNYNTGDDNINNSNRSTVQELRLRFGHSNCVTTSKDRTRNNNNKNRQLEENDSHLNLLSPTDRIVNHQLSTTSYRDNAEITRDRHNNNNILLADDKYDISTSPRPIGHSDNRLVYDTNNNDNNNHNNRYCGQGNRTTNRPHHSVVDPQQNTGRTNRSSSISSHSTGSQCKQTVNQTAGYNQQYRKTLDKVSQSMRDIIHDLNVESPGSNHLHKGDRHNNIHKTHTPKQSPTQFVSGNSNERNSCGSSALENSSNSARRNHKDGTRNITGLTHSYSIGDNIHVPSPLENNIQSVLGLRNSIYHRRSITYQEAAMLASKGLRIYEDSGDYLLPIQERKQSLAKTLSEPKVSWEAASYLIVPTVVESFNNSCNVSNFNSSSDDLLQPSSVLDILTQRSISDSGAANAEINNGAHSDGDVCSDNEYLAMTRNPPSKMRARAMSVDLICKDATSENNQDNLKGPILNPNVAKVSTRIKRKDRRPSRGYVEWKTCSGWIGGVDMRDMSKRNSRGYVEWDTIWTPASSTKGDGTEDEHVYDVIQDEQTVVPTPTTTETTLSGTNEEMTTLKIVTSSDDSDVPPALPERTYINRLKQSEESANSHHRLCPRHSPHSHHHQHSLHPNQQHQHSGHQQHPHQSHRHHHRHSNSPSSSNRRHHHHHQHNNHSSSPHRHHHRHHHHHHKDSNSSLSSSASTVTSSKLKSSNKPQPGERHPPPTHPPPQIPPPTHSTPHIPPPTHSPPPIPPPTHSTPQIPPPTHSPPPIPPPTHSSPHIPPPTHSPPPLPPPNPPPSHSSSSTTHTPITSTQTASTTIPNTSQNYAQVSKLKGYTFGNLMTSHDSTPMASHHHNHHHNPKDKSSAIYSENYCHLQPLTSEDRMTLWKPADVLDYIDGLHETIAPGRRENIYILLNNKKTRAKFSESLEIESRLLSKGLLGACVSKLDIDATALPDHEDIGDIAMDNNMSGAMACGAVAAPEIKKRARVPVSSTYV